MKDFVRVSRRRPCPICGKRDWCMVAKDGGTAICPRVPEGAKRYLGDAGYLHELVPGAAVQPYVYIPAEPEVTIDAPLMARMFSSLVTGDQVHDEAKKLGVTASSLWELDIGWSAEHRAFSFPMRDEFGTVVGIRLRRTEGFKWAIRGSRNALFIPSGSYFPDRTLCITEGPTDTAAALTLGLQVIGRPFCRGGTKMLVEMVKQLRAPVAIISDADGPGVAGAEALADELCGVVDVRVIRPLNGKDLRAWLSAGVSGETVKRVIENATPWRRKEAA